MLKNKKGEILEKLSHIPTKDDSTMIRNTSWTIFVYSFMPYTASFIWNHMLLFQILLSFVNSNVVLVESFLALKIKQ